MGIHYLLPHLPLRIRRRDDLALGVVGLTLEHTDGAPLPPWEPGAHLGLLLRPGMEREYSLCGDLDDPFSYTIAVRRIDDGRGGSRFLHDELREGSVLAATRIGNNFPFSLADRLTFVAGGIGITPLLPMLRQAAATTSAWDLLYVGRTRQAMAFRETVSELAGGTVTMVETAVDGRVGLSAWLQGREDSDVYCCGPNSMLEEVTGYTSGWAGAPARTERFTPIAHTTAGDSPFDVVLDSNGQVIHVPAGTSLLSALLKAGIRIPFSCREGTCGSCEVGILEGVADHRDSNLTPEEQEANEYMYACVSRARSAIIRLDL